MTGNSLTLTEKIHTDGIFAESNPQSNADLLRLPGLRLAEEYNYIDIELPIGVTIKHIQLCIAELSIVWIHVFGLAHVYAYI